MECNEFLNKCESYKNKYHYIEREYANKHECVDQFLRDMAMIKERKGVLREMEDFAASNRIPIVQPEAAQILLVLGKLAKPRRILEIGAGIGYSAILLAAVLEPGGKLDTIEKNETMARIARGNIKKAGLEDTINVIEGCAEDVLKCLDQKYEMIFLDAAKGQYVEFLPECLRILAKGGLLISDNVLYKGRVAGNEPVVRRKRTIVKRMREYLRLISGSDELETCVIPVGDGIAASYKNY